MSKSCFILELNPYHEETLFSYSKYFSELGYEVTIYSLNNYGSRFDLLYTVMYDISKLNATDNILFYNTPDVSYPNGKGDEPSSITVNEFLTQYNFDYSKFSKVISVMHDTRYYDYYMEKMPNVQFITLSKTPYNLPVVNPSMFSPIKRSLKFIIPGDGGRRDLTKLAEIAFDCTIYITGRYSEVYKDKLEINNRIKCMGMMEFSDLCRLVNGCDYIIPYLDPLNENHDAYKAHCTSGAVQLSYGYNKPMIIHSAFTNKLGLNEHNSIIYNDSLFDGIEAAINTPIDEYINMKVSLAEHANKIRSESYSTLKKLLE